ncbi:2-dehydro-3-deoxyphosphogluconate aldolase/(4S)-4-hydroxy-2-oxoglutarate aldolase [Microbacterium sp. AG157]|uniref:bifunctional 4-hydroxy-2-oxoglutarate aldolase/2-dehydro-3-deoxy-phosphogluconate aldolase n=1 Tax=Microbacterium sp. AG157 TaxID=2183993 RepID=UPI000E2886B5|nr:bifunctional 4-hydroxy-2-oxoglutarate aldolase/2-dehydro-3-deoxy-phosphogluconate aldolase [Microbacterium sp. AG157]REC98543.1 2-dehydro-3-deoxyphosphogluconate aldolase/(4S)-4-hydroxy-2-oxoglutarate aldolase [Microbacterium sp. AG157]
MTRSRSALTERISAVGIVPVVVLDDADRARDVALALRDGGIGCAEFTLRTPAGLAAIAATADIDGFLAGAGTVLTVEQADAAIDAGASFAVTPGYDPAIADRLRAGGVEVVPGVATPTEVQRALADGFRDVKIFPAGHLGGAGYLDALHGPFPDMRFVPSGGVDPGSLGDYLRRSWVLAASGSWMVPRDVIARGDFDTIRTAAADCARIRDDVRAAR